MKNMMIRAAISACAGVAFLSIGVAGAEEMKSYPTPKGHPLPEVISGYDFRTPDTQALQDDDFQNPGFLWVEQGEALWSSVDGAAGKSCASCHEDAANSMATAGAEFPKWNDGLGKPVNLDQQINLCRTEQMKADAWKLESDNLLAMTTYVRNQARGKPVNVSLEGPIQEWWERGKQLYYQTNGQLDMSCANCHEDNYGVKIRSEMLSQGQSNGFPTYRLKWQKLGSLHRRLKGCMEQIRAEPYKPGSDEFLALEIYLAYRGVGLPVETPSVRQ